MKILFISARLCFPMNTGAKIRAYHLLRTLASRHDVTLVTYYGKKEEERYFPFLEEMGITLVPLFNPGIDSPLTAGSLVRGCFGSLPLTIAKYQGKRMTATVASLLPNNFDAIHCEHLHVSPCIEGGEVPLVLDAHNVESQIAGRYASAERNLLKRLLLDWNHRRLLRYESQTVRSCDLVLAVSDEDRDVFRAFGAGEAVRVLENGVDIDYFRPGCSREGNSLVFVGSMDWRPNISGIEYFLDEIFPLVRQARSEVSIAIVGKDPPDSLARRADLERGVVVTGTVSDVRPYLEAAAVCIVPLRIGGGTRLKVLEGFAMGKAVVSTSLGCEGIACRNGEHLIVADNPRSFAQAVLDLLADPGKRRLLGENARKLAAQRYSWDALGEKLLDYYEEIRENHGS